MFSRTSFLALLFVGLISLLPREAMAQLPPWDSGIDFPQSGWGGGWGSTIQCAPLPGGTNTIGLASLDQLATVECIVTESTGPTPLATCQLEVHYSNLTLLQPTCTAVTGGFATTVSGDCNTATVTGTLKCNPQGLTPPPPICGGSQTCTAQVGVPSGNCANNFPADSFFAAGQIALATVTTKDSSCTGAVTGLSDVHTRWCGPGTFGSNQHISCPKISGTITPVSGHIVSFLPVDVEASPTTVNVSCTGTNKDKGSLTATIFGSAEVDVTTIKLNPMSVNVEGVSASSCTTKKSNTDAFLDLVCKVPTCSPAPGPSLGPILQTLKTQQNNPDGSVTIQVTGVLADGNTDVKGETSVFTSP